MTSSTRRDTVLRSCYYDDNVYILGNEGFLVRALPLTESLCYMLERDTLSSALSTVQPRKIRSNMSEKVKAGRKESK